MNKRIWLTLIVSAIVVTGLTRRGVAQTQRPESEIVRSDEANRAILAARYAHGPRLIPSLSRKAGAAANEGFQPSEQQADSDSNAAVRAAHFITFDAPGAAPGVGYGTIALSINPKGEITGYYLDVNAEWHGFLRARDGAITTFDPLDSVQTAPGGINPAGTIAGYYLDANIVYHGFLRARDGSFDTFDLPAGSTVFTSTLPSINPEGAITGYYGDASYVPHSFLRTPNGTFTTFDAPGASGTFANSINPAGAIAGYDYVVTFDPSFSLLFHGLLRTADGTITTFDAPGALDTFAVSNSINPEGAIAGFYYDASMASHGYVRAPDGTFKTFNVPGAGTGAFQGTGLFGISINAAGAITGTYVDANNVVHGFLRAPDGSFTAPLDAPGSTFTFPADINPAGAIAGYYGDANGNHSFLWTPHCKDGRSSDQWDEKDACKSR